LSPPLGIY
jgi:hypothetical protein